MALGPRNASPAFGAALAAACAVLCACAPPARAQGRLSGVVFADAAWNAAGYRAPDSVAFRLRRVQFTFDNDLDSLYSVRFQLEADEKELTSSGKTTVFLKQAWLRRAHLGAAGDLVMGLSPTPLWTLDEALWGYRSLEKTILDLNGFGSATDMGVALQRAPGAGHPLGWHLMVANGNGQKPENDDAKKFMLSVPVRAGDWVFEGVGDFEGRPGPRDRWTAKLLAGWQRGASAFGIEGFRRVDAAAGTAGADVVPEGLSGYGRVTLGEHARAVGRVDWLDPDGRISGTGWRELLVIGALDFMPQANVHVMPNVLVRGHLPKSDRVPSRDTDVTLRVTLHYNFR